MEEAFCLQDELLEEESSDEFTYDEVVIDDDLLSSGDEDLYTARQNNARTRTDQTAESAPAAQLAGDTVPVQEPEVVEDFVRNYLVSNGMLATAECFQKEWYKLAESNELRTHQTASLPDVYTQNSCLEATVKELRAEVISYKEAARLCKEKYIRLQKERDYHRMHHRRMIQEKNKLIADIKRLRKHFASYEPLLKELRQKYQTVTKEKMMACLERDRAISEVGCLQSTLTSVQQSGSNSKQNASTNQHNLLSSQEDKSKDYEFPQPPRKQTNKLPLCAQFTRTGGLQVVQSYEAHEFAIGSISIHPSKNLAVTGSDDHTWKMWTIPSGDLVLSGEGHTDWIADVQFHPSGKLLATSSGDGTVKVWDFQRSKCTQTFAEHQQPVWSCSWHWAGIGLASGGMDHTVKLWDTNKGVCMQTLRGHADCVNGVMFIPYSNTLISCSADKTISLWDVRTGLCVQTYYGHQHSCNYVTTSSQGTQVYTCDSFGSVLQWDIRGHSISGGWELGPYGINALAIDPAGVVLCCASANTTIKLIDTSTDKEWCLEEHKDSVLSVKFSCEADTLLSTDNSGTLIIWQ